MTLTDKQRAILERIANGEVLTRWQSIYGYKFSYTIGPQEHVGEKVNHATAKSLVEKMLVSIERISHLRYICPITPAGRKALEAK